MFLQSNNSVFLPKEESIRTFDSLKIIAPARTEYMYNNHAFNIVGLIIESLSGKNWGDFLKERLFQLLNMTRTYTEQPEDPNVTLPYNILLDGTAYRIPRPVISDMTLMFAAASVRSSMADLLNYYQSCLRAIQDLTLSDESETLRASPFKQIAKIMQPHIARPVDSLLEQTCALAWNRTQLPGKLDYGWNSKVVDPDSFPVLGEHVPGKLAVWHGGNMPGITVTVCLLPESSTAVVVLQNSLGLCNIADLASQAIIDTIFTGKPRHDYVGLARERAKNTGRKMENVEEQFDKENIRGTHHRSLESYGGIYRNTVGN
ncbi:hypothetical protein MMC14_005904 [Varicellaria rhodocarpa]|nr:hypothetical protein [Varicellaria rhodocarpa]